MEKTRLTNLEIEKKGKEYFKNLYKEQKGIELVSPNKKEYGFDLKTPDSKEFFELKVTLEGTSTVRQFNVTQREIEKAKECIEKGLIYNFMVIYTDKSGLLYHRILSSQYVIPRIKQSMQGTFYIKAGEIEEFQDL